MLDWIGDDVTSSVVMPLTEGVLLSVVGFIVSVKATSLNSGRIGEEFIKLGSGVDGTSG